MTATQHETTRLEAFSDGVFAIAITLLILEIRVPPPEVTLHGKLLPAALRGLWPSYLGYGISFLTLGIMWANHHALFLYVRKTDRYFLIINVFLLMCISFLPFPTGLLAEYLPDPEGRTAATAFYGATLFVISLAFNAVWRYASAGGRLLGAGADPDAMAVISRRYLIGPLAYLLAFGLAFVNVWASLGIHFALALMFLLPERRS